MNDELEEMLEVYKHLTETVDMTPAERVFLAKQRRDLWWEIRQASNGFSKAVQMKIYRTAHPEKALEQWLRQRDRNRGLKIEVLTHYGGGKCSCVKCGFSDVRALSIDHIAGGGNRQRKGKLRTSTAFYGWLKSEGYLIGYQTLCMNCQFVKRFENDEHN